MHTRLLFFSILILLFIYSHFKIRTILPKKYFINWISPVLFYLLIVSEQFIYRFQPESLNSKNFVILFWMSSFAMGLWATYVIFSLFVDALTIMAMIYKKIITNKLSGDILTKPERRYFLTQSVSWGVLTSASVTSGFGLNTILKGPVVQKVVISVPDLAKGLEGFKIAQISDLHVGPTVLKNYVENVVRITNSLEANLIAVTGDLVDGSPDTLSEHVEPLSLLRAPHGVLYVTGNHEYYWGVERWLEKIQKLGMRPMMNENFILNIGGAKILIAGVTDTSGEMFKVEHRSDPRKAIKNSENSDYKVLLAHRPDSYLEAEAAGFNLQLSGHTHAGQFFPFNFIVALAHKYYRGLNLYKRLLIYVNSGTGYWGPANRFAVPSEITLIELKRS